MFQGNGVGLNEITKVMTFLGPQPVLSKIIINHRIIEQVLKFNVLGAKHYFWQKNTYTINFKK
jgi:hypothetical protein